MARPVVLVDSAVWIDFFRGVRSPETDTLDELLADGLAAVAGPVHAAIVSGTRTTRERSRLEGLLAVVEVLEDPPDLWQAVADARFRLARAGSQASLVDLVIALTAAHHGVPVLTGDEDFLPIARLLRVEIFRRERS